VLRYVARRLLLAIPTLVGISIVTFLVIHLAPGEPGTPDSPRPVTREVIEAQRRAFFLDLPLFVNLHVEDRRYLYARLIDEVSAGDADKRGARADEIARRGTVAVPYLGRARGRPGVAEVLARICADHPHICPGSSVDAMIAACEHAQPRREWGTAAVPALMEIVREGSQAERIAAVGELAKILGNQSTYGAASPPDRRERALGYWREWWFKYERDYREFDRWERALGTITETQYAKWVRRLATGTLGDSLRTGRPVSVEIAEAFPATALLSLLSLFFAYIVALPIGVWSAVRHQAWFDRVAGVVLFMLYSLPAFWTAAMLVLLLGGVGFWDVLPIYGMCPNGAERFAWPARIAACTPYLVLPVVCLSYTSLAVISRYQRTGMLEVIRLDFIRTARAKGLSERAVVLKHALRNSLLPVITHLGMQIPALLGGSIIVERIFTIRGMGWLVLQSITARDYPVIMGETVLAAALTMGSVLICDVLYAVVDPRVTAEKP
jgi:peptide/nickel transport system permease protein